MTPGRADEDLGVGEFQTCCPARCCPASLLRAALRGREDAAYGTYGESRVP
jgi:hypothetical protein